MFNLKLDWKEGLYTLLFQDNMTSELLYLDGKYRKSNYKLDEKTPTIENSNPIKDSWCNLKQPPIQILPESNSKESTNGKTNGAVWKCMQLY